MQCSYTIFSGIESGVRSYDPHVFAHHEDDPLIIDEPLREGGRHLASISCAGRSRALQPLGPDGVPGPVCCTGQTVTMCGHSRNKRDLGAVCDMLGAPRGLVRGWT